jgi:hypothetical protein
VLLGKVKPKTVEVKVERKIPEKNVLLKNT